MRRKNMVGKTEMKIKLSKADKELLTHILNEHLSDIKASLMSPYMLNKDKASLRREAKRIDDLKIKLGL